MEITPAAIEAFRTDYPGFSDTSDWPEPKVKRALQLADRETGSGRWGDYAEFSIKQRGMFAFAAHHLTQQKLAATATEAGGAPAANAQLQSKMVADESATYAVGVPERPSGDEGLMATAYGQEFVRLRRRVGRGGSSSNARRFL